MGARADLDFRAAFAPLDRRLELGYLGHGPHRQCRRLFQNADRGLD